jgi:hypothetical protein
VPVNSSRVAATGTYGNGQRHFVLRAAGVLAVAFLVVVGARFLFGEAVPYLIHVSPDKFGRFWPDRAWLLPHVAGGGLALIVGPFQFWSGLRRRSMGIHRWTGRLYVVGVLIGGCAAFYLASQAAAGAAFGISLGALGAAWWTTTGMAYLAIRRRQVSQHKEWMIRSYVVTFTFVTFRLWMELGALQILGQESAATLVWLSWSMPLLATEVVLQGRKVMRRSEAV